MEEFIIEGKSVSILGKEDIDQEINRAAIDRRQINFSGKNLKFLSLVEKDMATGIDLSNCWVAGNVFLGNSVVNGNINLRNANIDGSFFFGHGKVMGELNMEKIRVGQTANMVGLNITGSLHLNSAKIEGFISLSKAVILGNLDMRNIEVRDYKKDELTVKGDVFLQSAQINGFFDISDSILSGAAGLENAMVRRSLMARNLKTAGNFDLRNCIFNKETADFSGTDPEKIIQ